MDWNEVKRTIFVLGDSVAAPRTEEEAPMAGWGQKIEELLVGPYEVANYARSAMTTRKYFTERLPGLLNRMKPGDIVLLGFGCVDHMIHNGMRYVPVPEYKELLRLFAAYVQGAGGTPVVVTSAARYSFGPQGEVVDTLGAYPEATREFAAEAGLPLIDLNRATMERWAEIGPTRLRQYFCWVDAGEHPLHPEGNIDSTHFNDAGAYEVARMVVAGLCRHGVVPQSDVDVAALSAPAGMPEVSKEFLVNSPRSALDYPQRSGEAPVLARPEPDGTTGPMLKFSGTASPGTDYLLFFEYGHYLGGAQVGSDGKWTWRRAVNWEAGPHLVRCVGLRADGCTPISERSFTVRTEVEPPVITAPQAGAYASPRPRFTGTAQPGTTKIVLMEGDVLIGATGVEDGKWGFTHGHAWRAGTHTVRAIALFGAQESAPAERTFTVVGIPEDSPIRSAGASRVHDCGEACGHRPFTGDW